MMKARRSMYENIYVRHMYMYMCTYAHRQGGERGSMFSTIIRT